MRLHTSKRADWEEAAGAHNFWQKIASRSYGTLTPANVASFGGGILAIYGLNVVINGETVKGLALIAVGRFADLVDGLIAEYTKTKSPLGEIIDAFMDKVVMASALIVFIAIGLVPWLILAAVAVQNTVNVIISVIAKLRNKTIHPSQHGKLATALSWVTLILYPLGDWIRQDFSRPLGSLLILVSLASFGAYIIIGLQATLSYGHVIYKKAGKHRIK